VKNFKNIIIGSWLNSGSTTIAELMAQSSLDFLTIDLEHAPVDIELMTNILRAIRSGNPNCKAFIRTIGHEYQDIKRYMDAGSDGVIVPFVNDVKTAKSVVNAVKYPPLGKRGVGYARDNQYGRNILDKIKNSNNETFICLQIEHIDAINNIDEILSVEGVNAAFLGPYDLTASMGIAGEFENIAYLKACKVFLATCQKYSVLAGIHVVEPEPEQVLARIGDGYNMIAYSLDITMVTHLLCNDLKYIKDESSYDLQ